MTAVSPLSISRDDALALSRSIGDVVTVVCPLRTLVGKVVNVDSNGVIAMDCGFAGSAYVPMTEVTSWSPVKLKKGAHK